MRKKDPQGYYAALNISHRANMSEIRLAYTLLKQESKARQRSIPVKVRAAYATLSDPRKRREYDQGRSARSGRPVRPDGKSRLHSVPLLVVLLVAFVGTLTVVFGPDIMARFETFEVGDEVCWKATMQPFAVVLDYDPAHRFPDGPRRAAYLIEPKSGQDPLWYSARDLHRHATTY